VSYETVTIRLLGLFRLFREQRYEYGDAVLEGGDGRSIAFRIVQVRAWASFLRIGWSFGPAGWAAALGAWWAVVAREGHRAG
jgi:hypothetical protein